ncbi:hypothetical protein [Roseovarius sp. MS2]|uniref:hypothetical protein n=1 Tax=Roseovarius TaxID=74030 RepID=UPI003EDCA2CD
MQINVKSRAADGVANPYAEREDQGEGESRKRRKGVTLTFLALVSYWALLFAPKSEEMQPPKDRVDTDAAQDPAVSYDAAHSILEPMPPATLDREAADLLGEGTASGPQLAALAGMQSGPILGETGANAEAALTSFPITPRSDTLATVRQADAPTGPGFQTRQTESDLAIAAPDEVTAPSQPTVTQPAEVTPPFDLAPNIYDLTDLLADLRARTVGFSDDTVDSLVTFAVNDVLSETALRRLQTGVADLALGRFESEAQAFAELLSTPTLQLDSQLRSSDAPVTELDLAGLVAGLKPTEYVPPSVADLFQSDTHSF